MNPLQYQMDKLTEFLNKNTHTGSKIVVVHKIHQIELWTEEASQPFIIKRDKPIPTTKY